MKKMLSVIAILFVLVTVSQAATNTAAVAKPDPVVQDVQVIALNWSGDAAVYIDNNGQVHGRMVRRWYGWTVEPAAKPVRQSQVALWRLTETAAVKEYLTALEKAAKKAAEKAQREAEKEQLRAAKKAADLAMAK